MVRLHQREYSKLLVSHPVLLVSSRVGRSNTVSPMVWYTPVSMDHPMIGLSLKPSSTSYQYIRQSGDFILGVPDESMIRIVQFCGVNSGRWMDKVYHLNLTTYRGKSVSPLMLTGCLANIECKVRDIIHIGDRPFITGEVLDITADAESYRNGWLPHIQLIYYVGGNLYRIGDEIVNMEYYRPGLVPRDSIG